MRVLAYVRLRRLSATGVRSSVAGRRVLDRLPERRGVDDFAADYRRTVVNKLDRMELLGVTLADANRRYPLSIAYIDLTVRKRASREDSRLVIRSGPEAGDPLAEAGGLSPESLLSRTRRALIIGNAGSGKTTLLQWLAVRSALRDFGSSLTGWNDTVPFFIPLRRYVNRTLPTPEEFPLAVGRNVAHEMPGGWVHGLLRDGRALVLLDGVDEMPDGQREHVRSWLAIGSSSAAKPSSTRTEWWLPNVKSAGNAARVKRRTPVSLRKDAGPWSPGETWYQDRSAEDLQHAGADPPGQVRQGSP